MTHEYANDPVNELMHARTSLRFLAKAMDDDYDLGQANLVQQLAEQVDRAVEQLDEEDWKPTRKLHAIK